MSQLMDTIDYLAKQIGPRPAGTSEEQQAALYLTEQFQNRTGFSAGIEEFQRRARPDLSQAILGAVMILLTILAMLVPILAIPAFILGAIAAAIFVIELLGTPLLARVLATGNSQNVVAKYQPNANSEAGTRAVSRKIILVAHYDSGRVTPAIEKRFAKSKISLRTIAGGAMVAAAILLLLRIFIAISGGGVLVILNVLSVIALIICALPLLLWLMKRNSPLNEGANNNASGSAALVEVADRIAQGSVSEADLASYAVDVTIHGASAAESAGLVPEGASLTYDATANLEEGEGTEEQRLLAAKAAIAALTGKPVERRIYGSLTETEETPDDVAEEELVVESDSKGSITQISDEEFATAFKEYRTGSMAPIVVKGEGATADAAAGATDGTATAAALAAATAAGVAATDGAAVEESASEESEGDVGGFHNAPSWFVAAQKNAKRSSNARPAEVQRSRFTEAMESAERERTRQEEEIRAAEEAAQEAERLAREAEAAAAIAAAAEQRAQEASAAARLQDATQVMSPNDLPGGNPVLVEEAVETEVESGTVGAAPKATDGAPASEETALEAELISEETIAEDTAGSDKAANAKAVAEEAASESPAEEEPLSRVDRLRKLRTNVPSLSGVIRTKDAARKAAVKAVPDVRNIPVAIDESDAIAVAVDDAPTASGEAPRIIDEVVVAETEPTPIPTEHSTHAPAARSRAAQDLSTSSTGQLDAIDQRQRRSSRAATSDFNAATEGDFSENLVPDGASGTPRSSRDRNFDAPIESRNNRKSGGFFNRFRKKNTEEEAMDSPQSWLGVDEDFEARSVGRARGGWESFRTEDGEEDPFNDDSYETFDDFGTDDAPRKRRDRGWEGGSASRRSLGHVDMRSGDDAEGDAGIPDTPPEAEHNRFVTGEIERIYHFRNPAFNTEIWFVAIGSDDVDSHDGIYAFLDEHKAEMRGSTLIEIESLGAGALAVATREGAVRKVAASSRIKRFTRDVVAATGISLDEVDMSGTESIASIVQKAGFQSMHLFGAENGRPALKGSADDVVENIDELVLEDYVNFVYELLKR